MDLNAPFFHIDTQEKILYPEQICFRAHCHLQATVYNLLRDNEKEGPENRSLLVVLTTYPMMLKLAKD